MTQEPAAVHTGEYDQSLAAAAAEVDRLVGILQVRAAEAGERQAVADVCALVSQTAPDEVAGLLAAALLGLARHRGQ